MILFIPTKEHILKSFLNILKKRFISVALLKINILKIQEYNKKLKEIYSIDIDYYKAIKQALNELIFKNDQNGISIILSDDIYYLKTEIKLVEIIKIVEYGKLDINPYPIIRNTKKEIENNFNTYYARFIRFGW